MSVHMFSVYIGIGSMAESDLTTACSDWTDQHTKFVDGTAQTELEKENTEPDGSGDDYHHLTIRFEKTDTKDNIVQKLTDKIENKVDWYRVLYHDCDRKEDGGSDGSCSWDSKHEWSDKDVTIPSSIYDPEVTT